MHRTAHKNPDLSSLEVAREGGEPPTETEPREEDPEGYGTEGDSPTWKVETRTGKGRMREGERNLT